MQLIAYCKGCRWRLPLTRQNFLAMKMLTLILFIACLAASAKGLAQNITISLKNAPLEKVFKEIERQSHYRFVYTREQLANGFPITIDIKNSSVESVLFICFKDQPVAYKIESKYILVTNRIVAKVIASVNVELINITGKVVNEKNEPLVGITITIRGSRKMAVTDSYGEFAIKNVQNNDVLVVSGAEVDNFEININGQTRLVITIKEKIGTLDETIVKGYYTTSRRLNTGSVGKVTSKEISNQPVSNPLATLQGRIPGLEVIQQNGLPGSGFSVIIRGQNSIQNGISPLYVIDGMPFLNDADVVTQRGSGVQANSPFNSLNPADIESIQILKDADATAIYGSRGANGVILITTKSNKSGKTAFDVNVYSGWGRVTRTINFMNTRQYVEMRKEAYANDGVNPTLPGAKDLLLYDTLKYTDLKAEFIGNTANSLNANIRMSGGNSWTRFTFGGNYYNETTVFPGDHKFERVSANLNVVHRSENNKFDINFNASFGNGRNALQPDDLTQYINLPPDIPDLYDSLGKLTWSKGGISFLNPLAGTLKTYTVITDRLTSNILAGYKIIPSLKLKLNLGANLVRTDEKLLSPIVALDPSNLPTGSAFFGMNQTKGWIIEPQLEYTWQKETSHKLQLMIGTTLQETVTTKTGIAADGYTNDNLINSLSAAQTTVSSNQYTLYHYTSIYGRGEYNYKSKYIVNLTGRRDISSRFGPGKRTALFGAIGSGWIFSEEKFGKRLLPYISYGKLRASYGITGNDLIQDYQYLDTYTATRYPYQGQTALFPSRLFNPDYSWEQIRKVEVALELGFIKDRIMFIGNWYRNRSDNQIIYYSLPGQTGFTNVLTNFPGVVQNKGFELSLNSTNIKNKKFTWSTAFNITFPKNTLVAFPGLASSTYSTQYEIGKPLNLNKGYRYAGVDPQTGIYQFVDFNSDNLINDNDIVYNGTNQAKSYGGLANNLQCKNWELEIFTEFRKQNGNNPFFTGAGLPGTASNQAIALIDRWQKPGDIATYQKFSQRLSSAAGSAYLKMLNSSAAITDASYIRLKNIALSWKMPSKLIQKLHLQRCRFYVQGQNLFVITNYKGADPESQSILRLPPLKMVVMGIQLNF